MTKSLRDEQAERWREGERLSVEAYVHRNPALASDPDALADLILGEMLLREAAGEPARLDEYLRRFPQCAASLNQRYRADMVTAIAQGTPGTLNMSPSPLLETLALDEQGQLAAQESAWQASIPKIPGYEIRSELGRGGMGVVYRARQLSAGRDVALKIVRNDVLDTLPMATRTHTLQRFKHEAHAAARLEHGNLVPVYDVGEAGSLRYYAMRFVDGTSLYDMLRERPLSNRLAAQYLEPIARGLHFAHTQGVLHRDVKPHNIIVERASDRPMLTDFGLAKFLEQRDELTHAGDVMGTPSYMSPEQCRDSGQVTALADVYSLGATLYHVLTSRPPFQSANVAETIRQVLHDEPVPPRQLNPGIDRDLETICLKCLQKEPGKRYESAGALADDLQRYLDHKPILARPISRTERVLRWCRRSPKLAAALSAVSLLAIGFVVSIVIGYVSTSRALTSAESRLDHALLVVDDLATRISEEELLNEPGMQPLRKDLLERALVHYRYFLEESGNDPKVQDKVAAAHFRVGVITQLDGSTEGLEAANRELTQARDLQQQLLEQTPGDPRRLKALGDTLNALGSLLQKINRLEESLAVYTEAEAIRSQLAARSPNSLEWQRLLANAFMNRGIVERARNNFLQAESYMQRAQQSRLKILETNSEFDKARRDLAMGYFNLAELHLIQFYDSDDPRPQEHAAAGIAHLRDAVKHFEQLGDKEAGTLTNRYYLATAFQHLGGILSETGDVVGALKAYEEAMEPLTRLAVGNPTVDAYRAQLSLLSMNEGHLHRDQKNYGAARAAYTKARQLLEQLRTRDPENPSYRTDLAGLLGVLGHVELLDNDPPSAIETLELAVESLEQLVRESPGAPDLITWLGDARRDLERAQRIVAGDDAIAPMEVE